MAYGLKASSCDPLKKPSSFYSKKQDANDVFIFTWPFIERGEQNTQNSHWKCLLVSRHFLEKKSIRAIQKTREYFNI